ncbi:MAG: GtrA family protein [Gammaproteobacteria bacterium]|nr:GtrA family protein [Gammaproteobacteria bacterium]
MARTNAQQEEFIRFVMVGGFAAGVNFLSRILFSEWASFRLAVVLAYIVGMITAYVLSKWLVFAKSGKPAQQEFVHFTLVNIAAVIQVWLISVGLVEYLFPYLALEFYPEEIGHFIGLSVPVVTSYFGHKHFTFARSKNEI